MASILGVNLFLDYFNIENWVKMKQVSSFFFNLRTGFQTTKLDLFMEFLLVLVCNFN